MLRERLKVESQLRLIWNIVRDVQSHVSILGPSYDSVSFDFRMIRIIQREFYPDIITFLQVVRAGDSDAGPRSVRYIFNHHPAPFAGPKLFVMAIEMNFLTDRGSELQQNRKIPPAFFTSYCQRFFSTLEFFNVDGFGRSTAGTNNRCHTVFFHKNFFSLNQSSVSP